MPTLQQTPAPVVPAPVPVVPVPALAQNDLQALTEQYRVLSAQVKGLQAQQRIWQRQLTSPQPEVRSAASEALTNVETQLVRANVDLADVRARLQAQRAFQTATQPNNPRPRPSMDSDTIVVIGSLLILGVLMPLAIGVARWMWRRPTQDTRPSVADTLGPRLDRLEQAVDAIAIEIERIAEGQRFVTKVMVERPLQPGKSPESNDAASVGEAKPFLALGAGPIEPVRMEQRQGVRQSITPH